MGLWRGRFLKRKLFLGNVPAMSVLNLYVTSSRNYECEKQAFKWGERELEREREWEREKGRTKGLEGRKTEKDKHEEGLNLENNYMA